MEVQICTELLNDIWRASLFIELQLINVELSNPTLAHIATAQVLTFRHGGKGFDVSLLDFCLVLIWSSLKRFYDLFFSWMRMFTQWHWISAIYIISFSFLSLDPTAWDFNIDFCIKLELWRLGTLNAFRLMRRPLEFGTERHKVTIWIWHIFIFSFYLCLFQVGDTILEVLKILQCIV